MNTPNKKKKLLHQNELIKVSAEEETGFWRFFRLNAHETKVTLHCVEGLLRPAAGLNLLVGVSAGLSATRV